MNNWIEKIRDAAIRRFGSDNVMDAVDLSRRVYRGIRLPPLCLQYLLQANVFPLGHIVHMHGPRKTGKSSLALQLVRWMIDSQGWALYIDAENKIPADIAESLLGDEESKRHLLIVRTAVNLEEAKGKEREDALASTIATILDFAKGLQEARRVWNQDKDGPEPCGLIILDSLPLLLPKKDEQKLEASGMAISVAPYGQAWSRAFVKIARELHPAQASFIVINHERQEISFTGPYAKIITPGPRTLGYQTIFELRVRPASGFEQQDLFLPIQLTAQTSSIGRPNRHVPYVRLSWAEYKEFTFEWDDADIKLCASEPRFEELGMGQLQTWGESYRGTFVQNLLGKKKASAEEILAAMRGNEELMQRLYKLWNIMEREVVNGKT